MPEPEESDRPDRATSRAVGMNLARIRATDRRTIASVADGLNALGLPMSPSGISDIEAGRRSVSVDQLTALAMVLGVSPVALLVPFAEDPEVPGQLTGTGNESAGHLLLWAQGVHDLAADPRDAEFEDAHFRRRSLPRWRWEQLSKGSG